MREYDSSSPSWFWLVFGTLWCAGMVAIGITTALHIADYSGMGLGAAVSAIVLMTLCFVSGVAGFAAITGYPAWTEDQ